MPDVFAPPESESDPEPSGTGDGVPAYFLFTANHVAGATFLGSPLTGAVLMGLNAHRLGLPLLRPVGLSVGLFLAFTVLAAVLPEQVPGIVPTLAGVFGMRALAESEFGPKLLAHSERGGATAPWWHAALIGGAGLMVVGTSLALLFFGLLYAAGELP